MASLAPLAPEFDFSGYFSLLSSDRAVLLPSGLVIALYKVIGDSYPSLLRLGHGREHVS